MRTLQFAAASAIANSALGAGAGWTTGWRLNQANHRDSLLYATAAIPVMALAPALAVLTSVHTAVPATAFLGATAVTTALTVI